MTEQRDRRPRLCIGLVVFNGEAFLKETIRSLLAQTYSDFELVISDNASTDATAAIVRYFQREDPRIRSHTFAANQGPSANYNKVVELATASDYFMWSAADDVRKPRFVQECVGVLDREPRAVLSYSRTTVIEDGRPSKGYEYEPDIDAATPHERLRTLLFVDHKRHGAFEIFGVMRLGVLREVLPQGAYARADSVMLVRMALRGRFVRVPEYLFMNRNHPDRSVRRIPARSYHANGTVVRALGSGPVPPDEWWDASKKDSIVWPEWNLARQYAAAVESAPLSPGERRACRQVLAGYVICHVPKLGRDVLINAEFQWRRSADRPPISRLRAPGRSDALTPS